MQLMRLLNRIMGKTETVYSNFGEGFRSFENLIEEEKIVLVATDYNQQSAERIEYYKAEIDFNWKVKDINGKVTTTFYNKDETIEMCMEIL